MIKYFIVVLWFLLGWHSFYFKFLFYLCSCTKESILPQNKLFKHSMWIFTIANQYRLCNWYILHLSFTVLHWVYPRCFILIVVFSGVCLGWWHSEKCGVWCIEDCFQQISFCCTIFTNGVNCTIPWGTFIY